MYSGAFFLLSLPDFYAHFFLFFFFNLLLLFPPKKSPQWFNTVSLNMFVFMECSIAQCIFLFFLTPKQLSLKSTKCCHFYHLLLLQE